MSCPQYLSHLIFSSSSLCLQLLHEAAYGEETPLGSPFLPSKREFKALSAEAVLAFRARTYASSNLIVTASGISAANLKVLLESHLHGLPKGGEKAISLPPSPYMGGDVKVKADLEGKTVLGLGFNVAGAKGAELLVQSLITAKLGKSHHVTSFCHTYVSSTLLGFVVEGQSPAAASAALEAIVAELKSMASSSADSKSLESFRKHVSLKTFIFHLRHF